MASSTRVADFLAKAERHLLWAKQSHVEMRDHGARGQIGDVERLFTYLLAQFASIHEALASCAKVAHLGAWRTDLNNVRANDPLLLYMWKARDSEIHDALVKWVPSMKQIELRVVDAAKAHLIGKGFRLASTPIESAQRLLWYSFGVASKEQLLKALKTGAVPSPDRMSEAGVELIFSVDCLTLRDFTIRIDGKAVTVLAPTSHLGAVIPPSTDVAVDRTHIFYQAKLASLRAECRLP